MSRSEEAKREDKEEKPICCCQKCAKFAYDMDRCGSCKLASYCSRECQESHWKLHKEQCRQTQETYKKAGKHDRKREFRLLRDWTDRSVESILFFTHKSLTEKEWLESTEKGKAIVLRVAFDYNRLTFKPTEPPAVSSTSDLSHQSIVGELEKSQKFTEKNGWVKVVVVIFKEYVLLFHCPRQIKIILVAARQSHGTS
jgi:hypothetical protein